MVGAMNRRDEYLALYQEMSTIPGPYGPKLRFVARLSAVWRNDLGPALEVGAGAALEAQELSRWAGGGVIASDIASKRLKAMEGRLPKVQFDATKPFPFRPATFVCVFAGFMVHLLNDDEKARFYENAFEALLKGGSLVVLTASEDDLRRRIPARFFPSSLTIDLERYRSVAWNIAQLRAAGFADVKDEPLVLDPAHVHEMTLYENRHASILRLIPQDEYEAGIERMRAAANCGPIVQPWIRTLLLAKK